METDSGYRTRVSLFAGGGRIRIEKHQLIQYVYTMWVVEGADPYETKFSLTDIAF